MQDLDAAVTATTAADARAKDRTARLILYDGLASEAMGTLTTGVFLTGVAVALNTSNAAIGSSPRCRSWFNYSSFRQP